MIPGFTAAELKARYGNEIQNQMADVELCLYPADHECKKSMLTENE